MWIYIDDCCCAFNIQDAYSIDARRSGENLEVNFKYKDIDGKACEYVFRFGSGPDSVEYARDVCKTILAQVKEVSGAKVTQELEDAIFKGSA
jgi:hypothetical protein